MKKRKKSKNFQNCSKVNKKYRQGECRKTLTIVSLETAEYFLNLEKLV